VKFRAEHANFRRRRWFQGRKIRGVVDIGWFAPDGTEMSEEDWEAGFAKSLGVFLNGDAIASVDSRGRPLVDDSFIVLFNAHHEPIEFTVPTPYGKSWSIVLDTNEPLPPSIDPTGHQRTVKAGDVVTTEARSLVLLRRLA
jgi:isoamylase